MRHAWRRERAPSAIEPQVRDGSALGERGLPRSATGTGAAFRQDGRTNRRVRAPGSFPLPAVPPTSRESLTMTARFIIDAPRPWRRAAVRCLTIAPLLLATPVAAVLTGCTS